MNNTPTQKEEWIKTIYRQETRDFRAMVNGNWGTKHLIDRDVLIKQLESTDA